MKERLADICAGLVGMYVAFIVKPSGWNIDNAIIWFTVFAAVYICVRLLFKFTGADRDND